MQEKSVALYFTEGSSDKVYQLHLRAKGDKWVVDYANGPRGKALRTGTKTSQPVDYEEAVKEFEKVLRAKKKDGYTEEESGAVYTSSEYAGRSSGISPQLCVQMSDDDLEAKLIDDKWVTQEKANGERRLLVYKDGELRGTNRSGLFVNIPEHWARQMASIPGNVVLDGEHVGDAFYAFDILQHMGTDVCSRSFHERYAILSALMADQCPEFMRLLTVNFGEDSKRRHLAWVEETRREGVVFKHVDAPYESGRSDDTLKYKIVASSTCLVLDRNQKRSVQIGMLDGIDGPIVSVGNVTIPQGCDVPAVGSLIEVEYLYYNPGGALEQPVYIGPRTDVTRDAAVLSQIYRIKPSQDQLEIERPRP